MSETTRTIRFGADAEPVEAQVQMAPLIDIVFLLICFYLLVAQLISTQSDPQVQLPTMNTPLAAQQQPAELVINLRQDGGLIVNNESLTGESLREVLADSLARAAEPLRVVIRADRRQEYRRLHEVLEICRDVNVPTVILRTEGGGQ